MQAWFRLFALTILMAPASVMAQVHTPRQEPLSYWYMGGEIGRYIIEKEQRRTQGIDNFWRPAFQAGRRFNKRVSAQLAYGQTEITASDNQTVIKHSQILLEGRLHWNDITFLGTHPYLGLGYARHKLRQTQSTANSVQEDMGVMEVGVQRLLGRNLMLDIGYRQLLEISNHYVDSTPFIALNYRFAQVLPAKPKPAPQAEPQQELWIDSDGDGVQDKQDDCPNTPRGARVDTHGCPIMLTEPVKITLHIGFAFNSSQVPPRYLPDIKKIATVLAEYPDSILQLVGHTDNVGRAPYNLKLSQSRAYAVRTALVTTFHIKPARIHTSGMGESQPIADNNTEKGRALNRRVEATIEASREIMEQK